jgi:anthranilate phosphoribosyltransferase
MSNGTVNDLGELHGLLARTLAENIKSGEATPAQIASILTALRI